MPRLVFTIGQTGSIEGLLKDKLINTSKFGERKIERITEIKFNEGNQDFYIKWLLGPYAGRVHTRLHDFNLFGIRKEGRPLFSAFATYEDAVDHEIKCVNRLRELGHSFA